MNELHNAALYETDKNMREIARYKTDESKGQITLQNGSEWIFPT